MTGPSSGNSGKHVDCTDKKHNSFVLIETAVETNVIIAVVKKSSDILDAL